MNPHRHCDDEPRLITHDLQFTPDSVDKECFEDFTQKWVSVDLAGFTTWLNRQTDETIRENGAEAISGQLQEYGHYEEAMEWEMSRSSEDTEDLDDAFKEWLEAAPDAPALWLESTNLPADRKEHLRNLITRPK